MIVRHQRESESNRGFRHLARYIHGRDTKPRATWVHAANLPGVSGRDDIELACKLVDAVQAQNTRAGKPEFQLRMLSQSIRLIANAQLRGSECYGAWRANLKGRL